MKHKPSSSLICVAMASQLSGCGVTVSLNDEGTAGLVEIGAFASAKKAREMVRAACRIGDDDPFNPMSSGPYLPAISHTVQPFYCMEPAKDIQ